VHQVDNSVKKYRPYTCSFVVKNLKFTDENIKSLMWIQEKIHETYGRKRKKVAVGVYDLEKISFPVTYCAKRPKEIEFVPLGMGRRLNGEKILQKHPTGRDYGELLGGFDKYPLQVDAQGEVLSMPPIINSDRSGKIDVETKDVFVECTGPDEDALDNVMNILATMFYDWNGQIFSVTIEDGKKTITCPNLKVTKRSITLEGIKNLIGIKLNTKEVSKLIQKMGHNVLEIKENNVLVSVPSVRTDIWHEVDLADDVARAYGYNNINATIPNISTVGGMLPKNILIEDLCNFLIGFGLIEVKTFALTNYQDQYEKMSLPEEKHISLGENTQDKNLSMVRSWLIPEMMKTLVANRNKEFPQNIFEVGTIVVPDPKADVKARNVDKLGCLLCGEQVDFTKIKQILDAVISFLDLNYSIKETKHSSFLPGRVGEIMVKGKKVGVIGEFSPQVLTNWDLTMPVAGLELDLEKIV
tara:strand:- start:653 stop:2059 length:1407 start_codon:yes stop_codon:yes gene_type:complete